MAGYGLVFERDPKKDYFPVDTVYKDSCHNWLRSY